MDLDFFKVVRTALGTMVRVVTAGLRGAGVEGDDAGAEPLDDAEVLSPLGLDSRPFLTADTQAVALRQGDEVLILVVRDKSRAKLTDLDEGETRLSGAKEVAARVRIRAAGKIEIDALAGQDVVVNGGALEVARRTDPVDGGTLTAVAGPTPVTFTYVPSGGGAPVVGPTALLTGGKITAGAGRFKG
jgi:phage gp45-like